MLPDLWVGSLALTLDLSTVGEPKLAGVANGIAKMPL